MQQPYVGPCTNFNEGRTKRAYRVVSITFGAGGGREYQRGRPGKKGRAKELIAFCRTITPAPEE